MMSRVRNKKRCRNLLGIPWVGWKLNWRVLNLFIAGFTRLHMKLNYFVVTRYTLDMVTLLHFDDFLDLTSVSTFCFNA